MAFNLFMHERNIYKQRPDFIEIATKYPEFRRYAVPDSHGRIHVDFNDENALRVFTKILLKKDFNLDVVIPKGFLIPTIPQRLNYLLWVEDLLDLLPEKCNPVSGIDIGTGPCAIFSILGAKKNNWNFLSTETSKEAIQWAEENIKSNNLDSHIKIIQVSKDSFLEDVMSMKDGSFDFCLCNPPFFENTEEIKKRSAKAIDTLASTAKKEEIIVEGGEVAFVQNLIRDSLIFRKKVRLYTSMFGRKKSFLKILKELQNLGISYVKTEFCQGNTIRWGVAWSFEDDLDLRKMIIPIPKKPKKAKPPLIHKMIISDDEKIDTIKKLSKKITNIFLELEIIFQVIKSAGNFAEIEITANKNTWSHQRRKRRELLKDKEESSTLNSPNSVIENPKKITEISEFNKSATGDSSSSILGSIDQTLSDSQSLTMIKKHKIEENELGNSTPKKLKFEDSSCSTTDVADSGENSYITIEDIPIFPEPVVRDDLSAEEKAIANEFLKKRKREDDNVAESSVSQKLKSDSSENNELTSTFEFKSECPKQIPTESKEVTNKHDDVSSSQSNSNSCSNNTMASTSLNVDDKILRFDSKALLYCTLKLRKERDHILLEMNCPPEANRESMHQIFQFIKNKLSVFNS